MSVFFGQQSFVSRSNQIARREVGWFRCGNKKKVFRILREDHCINKSIRDLLNWYCEKDGIKEIIKK